MDVTLRNSHWYANGINGHLLVRKVSSDDLCSGIAQLDGSTGFMAAEHVA
jgi:hypothetical protein